MTINGQGAQVYQALADNASGTTITAVGSEGAGARSTSSRGRRRSDLAADRFAIAPYWGGGIAGPTANKGPADMNTYDTNARPSQDQIAILRGR